MNKEHDKAVYGKEIPLALSDLKAILELLDESIRTLSEDLTQVLSPEEPTEGRVTDEFSSRKLSPLGAKLDELSEFAKNMADRVNSLNIRLQI